MHFGNGTTARAIRRIVPAQFPQPGRLRLDADRPWEAVPQWQAHWIHPADRETLPPLVGWFRLEFALSVAGCHRFSLTADERYDLWVDGVWVDSGPDRGDRAAWHFATYEMELAPGQHEILCRVWALGKRAPIAQRGVRAGMLLAGYGDSVELLSTGLAGWQWQRCHAWQFEKNGLAAPDECIDGSALAPTQNWQPPLTGESGNNGHLLYPEMDGRLLVPSELPSTRRSRLPHPPQILHLDKEDLNERFAADAMGGNSNLTAWTNLIAGCKPLMAPENSRIRVLLDLGVHCCGRVVLRTAGGGGARIQTRWGEALTFAPATDSGNDSGNNGAAEPAKAHRSEWRGGTLRGYTDCFLPDGGRRTFSTLWWRSGRFLAIELLTGEEPLTLEELAIEETGFGPWEITPIVNDPGDKPLAAVCVRTLQCCAHETTMDCPHYEQLAYAGDTRIQLLCWAHLLPGEWALYRHTLRHFHTSTLNPSGWSTSSAPSRGAQLIPPFSLMWVLIAQDYFQLSHDMAFLRPMLPALRNMVEKWLSERDCATGLCVSPDGWNFADAAFPGGIPPGGFPGESSGLLNWIVLHALAALQQLEAADSEPLLAQRWRQLRQALCDNVIAATWDEEAGLFLDAPGSASFSEHTQALACLYDELPNRQLNGLRDWLVTRGQPVDDGVVCCQAFFCYYLFAAMRAGGAHAAIRQRLQPWRQLLDMGFTTTPEHFGPTRSDCHAWSAHPVLFL